MSDSMKLLNQANELVMGLPGAAEIMEAAKRGEHTPMEAAVLIAGLLAKNPDKAESLGSLVQVGGPAAPTTLEHDNGSTIVNPLMEAAIKERCSIDGDAPEYRVGPLPEGGTPAVPVHTISPDPIALGVMLQQASDEVAQELRSARKEYQQLYDRQQTTVKALLESRGEDDPEVQALVQTAKDALPAPPLGVKGYEAGTLPTLREVAKPSPVALAALTQEERQKAAYLAIATTQGRRSLRPVVEELMTQQFKKAGYKVGKGDVKDAEKALKAVWTVEVYGCDEVSDSFSPATAAAETLTLDLIGGENGELLRLDKNKAYILEVRAINAIADRQYGWGALLLPEEEA